MTHDIPIVVLHHPRPAYSNAPSVSLPKEWTARSLLPFPSGLMGDPFWQPAAHGETREEAITNLRRVIEEWVATHRAELTTLKIEF